MKKTFISLLLLLVGCESHHKADDLIMGYMRKAVSDPNSYTPVSFGEQHPYKKGQVLVNHVYAIKNKAGAFVIYSNVFALDSTAGVVVKMPSPDATPAGPAQAPK